MTTTNRFPGVRLSMRTRRRLAEQLAAQGRSPEQAADQVRDLARFLLLAGAQDSTLCPTPDVDEAWHLLLEMPAYDGECLRLSGARVVHDTRKRPRLRRQRLARRTLAVAQLAFGKTWAAGWTKQAACGSGKCCGHIRKPSAVPPARRSRPARICTRARGFG